MMVAVMLAAEPSTSSAANRWQIGRDLARGRAVGAAERGPVSRLAGQPRGRRTRVEAPTRPVCRGWNRRLTCHKPAPHPFPASVDCPDTRQSRYRIPGHAARSSFQGEVLAHWFEDNALSMGRTPLVRLNHLQDEPRALILAKIEGRNPAYSVKDRIGAGL